LFSKPTRQQTLRAPALLRDFIIVAAFQGHPVGLWVGNSRLTDKSVAGIIKGYARRLGLNAADFSGHSLRSGFLTSAARRGASVIGALVNPNNPNAEPQARDLQAAASAIGLKLVILPAGTDSEIDSIFANLRERHIEALLVTADGLFFGLGDKLAMLAARYAMPTFYPLSDYVAVGGLISYGANLSESWRQAGIYAGKIIKGAQVADMPVFQATNFELTINLKTAKALGLEIPPKLLALADKVLE
jgi:ABC-type uncharacterized transport system substrate-binding protein